MWGWRAQSQMAAEWRWWSPSLPHPVGGPGLPTWARGSQQWASAGPRLPALPRAAGMVVLEPFSTSCRARCLLAHNGILFLLLLCYLLYIDAAPQRLLWLAGFLATLPATECCVQAEQDCLPCPPHSADSFRQLSCTEQPGSLPQEMSVLAIMWKKVWPWEKHHIY